MNTDISGSFRRLVVIVVTVTRDTDRLQRLIVPHRVPETATKLAADLCDNPCTSWTAAGRTETVG